MSNQYSETQSRLRSEPRTWLITGVAGFIGSNLLETLLNLDQTVIGLDNFATGHRANIENALARVATHQAGRFRLIDGDIRNPDACSAAVKGADVILHQAALGSVPRSIKDPGSSNAANVDGFIRILEAAREEGIRRFVYASSSSVYGDHPALPKVEDVIGQPQSPYAITKYTDELYAHVYGRLHGMECVGLRYFNVFGRRQDPNGAYAAVIPRWMAALIQGRTVEIYGDGETSRDSALWPMPSKQTSWGVPSKTRRP